ncbi:flap endonuclease-1 [Candidatus Woesearchaeota archaeon]|jgi:flap endonuclease-1|nr:flap endonuclease-1 [Candidatus Woesearchaeota archaeon]|tara:strand:+ start:1805 stop:2833 length:1029 start_codon:yes stop_codon:yes gene_type:complete
MGTAITNIIIGKEINIDELNGKILAVDSFNILYQFISTIRQRDGSLLKDSKGNVTSHLVGLFNRFTTLMSKGIKFVFVFDGEVPELKKAERERRKKLKLDASKLFEEAKKKGAVDDMKKYASRTAVLNEEMIEESKKLITLLGIPLVEAPSEGEAQASFMVKNGDCYAVVSQDADNLIFGANLVLKNLTISRKKKQINKLTYKTVNPEIISLAENLNNLGITKDQLIVISILVGTDYNIGGVKGIGPKKALKLVKQHGENFKKIFEEANWNFKIEWKEIFNLIKNIPVKNDYSLEWNPIDKDAIIKLLVNEHNFNIDRVEKTIDRLVKNESAKNQKGLGDFF